MNNARLPKEVTEWITKELFPFAETSSLYVLTIPSLKTIKMRLVAVDPRQFSVGKNSKMNKADWVNSILQCFYLDYPTCSFVNRIAVQVLRSPPTAARMPHATRQPVATTRAPNPNVAAFGSMPTTNFTFPTGYPYHTIPGLGGPHSAAATAAATSMFDKNGRVKLKPPKVSAASYGATAARAPNQPKVRVSSATKKRKPRSDKPSSSAKKRARTAAFTSDLPFDLTMFDVLDGPELTADALQLHPTPPLVATPNVYVKPEWAMNDPESTPRTPQERKSLGELQTMGFQNPVDILASYRKLHDQLKRLPMTDEVMLDLVAQREEADEARKMDEARLQSEQTRKAESKRRREMVAKELRQDIENASSKLWKSEARMFAASWILRDRAWELIDGWRARNKRDLIELLELEKKAHKWYQELPVPYFVDLGGRLQSSRDVGTTISKELRILQKSMFDLSQQEGGVPKLFKHAYDASNGGKEENGITLLNSSPTTPPVDKKPAAKKVDIIDLC